MKVFIYQGIPGSGKSTTIKARHPGAYVCSADDFFLNDDGVYIFDPEKLGDAHGYCLRKFNHLLTAGYANPHAPDLVVDNTNLTVAEVAPYAALAAAYGVPFTIVTLCVDPDVAAARNVHGLSTKKVKEMAVRLTFFRPPPYWPTESINAG